MIIKAFFIFLLFTCFLFFLNSIIIIRTQNKLYSYLKKNKYDRWRELTTTFFNIGPGARDSIKCFKYIYGNFDNDNEDILRIKDSFKIGMRYGIMIILTMFFNAAVLYFLIK